MSQLLDPGLLARLESLQLATRRRLAGRFAGEHRSRRHGSSPDFVDYRAYHPGDDFRRIDYHLYARLGVLWIKLFEADDEVSVRLVVDTSASMGIGGKLHQAVRAAAAVGFVALAARDPVEVFSVPGGGGPVRFSSRSAAPALFDYLASLRPAGRTPLAAAAAGLLARPGPPGLVVLLSDLLTPDWEQGLRRLGGGPGELVVVQVLAREDLEPDLVGDLDLIDVEDGARVEVSLSADLRRAFRRRAERWLESVSALCAQAGAACLRLWADEDLEAALLGAWRRAGVLR